MTAQIPQTAAEARAEAQRLTASLECKDYAPVSYMDGADGHERECAYCGKAWWCDSDGGQEEHEADCFVPVAQAHIALLEQHALRLEQEAAGVDVEAVRAEAPKSENWQLTRSDVLELLDEAIEDGHCGIRTRRTLNAARAALAQPAPAEAEAEAELERLRAENTRLKEQIATQGRQDMEARKWRGGDLD